MRGRFCPATRTSTQEEVWSTTVSLLATRKMSAAIMITPNVAEYEKYTFLYDLLPDGIRRPDHFPAGRTTRAIHFHRPIDQ